MEEGVTQKTALPLPAFKLKDAFCACLIVLLIPAAVVVFFCSLVLLLFPLFLIRALLCVYPSHRFQRHELYNFGFDFTVVVVTLLASPTLILAVLWAFIVALLIIVCSLPIAIFRPKRAMKSWLILVRGAPEAMTTLHYSSWGVFEDLIRVVAALMGRRKGLACWGTTALMIAFTPIYKFATFNPLLFDLQVVFVNQWTEVMGAEPVFLGALRRALKTILCTQPTPEATSFSVVVQCPSPHKTRLDSTVLGVQVESCYPAQLFPATHGLNPSEKGHGEWTLVGLPFNATNPFCSLVGHMEVDLRQDGALQCPMWVVMDPNSHANVNLVSKFRHSWIAYLGFLANESRVQAATFLQQQEQMQTDYAHKYSLLPRRTTTSSSNDEVMIDIGGGRHSSPSSSTSAGPFLTTPAAVGVPPSPRLSSLAPATNVATTHSSSSTSSSSTSTSLPAASTPTLTLPTAGKAENRSYPPPPPSPSSATTPPPATATNTTATSTSSSSSSSATSSTSTSSSLPPPPPSHPSSSNPSPAKAPPPPASSTPPLPPSSNAPAATSTASSSNTSSAPISSSSSSSTVTTSTSSSPPNNPTTTATAPTTPVMARPSRIATLKASEIPALGRGKSEQEALLSSLPPAEVEEDVEKKKREAKLRRVRYLKKKKEREKQEEEALVRNQQERLKRLLAQGEEAEAAFQEELSRTLAAEAAQTA